MILVTTTKINRICQSASKCDMRQTRIVVFNIYTRKIVMILTKSEKKK